MVLPGVGTDVCSVVHANSNLKELLKVPEAKENIKLGIAVLQKRELDLETRISDRLRLAVNVNFPFKVSSAYKLDPYFPLPCEADMFESKNCVFYISQKDYNCIVSNNNESVALEVIGSPAREYKSVSFGGVLLHTILIMAALYVMAAFFSHFRKKSRKHLAKNWKKAIEIAIAVLIVLGIITAILIYFLTLKTLTQ